MSEENRGDAPLSIDDWLISWENEGKSIGAPMVFISYAYATPEHCQWVKRLSDKLRNDGVNTVIDKYVPSGYDLAQFMEKGLRWPGVKYIVCVCSSLYTQKATSGTGGVGYEKMIVTRELVKQTNTNKFIPILRDNLEGETPDFLGTRFYCDFREDANFETMYQQLLQDLLGHPKAPPLGGAKKTQPFTVTPTSESRPTRLVDEQYKGSQKGGVQEDEERLKLEQEFAALLKDNKITEYDAELLKKISRNRKTLSIQLVIKRRAPGYYENAFKRALFSGNLPVFPEPQLDDGRVCARIDGQELLDDIQEVCASIRRLLHNQLLRFDGVFEGVEGFFYTFCFNGRSKDFLEYYNNISASEITVVPLPKSELRKIFEKGFGPTR